MSRRSLLRASARAGVGAAALALLGCSDDEEPPQQDVQEQPQQQSVEQPESAAQPQQQAIQQQAQQAQQQIDQQAEQTEQPEGPTAGGVIRAWLAVERHDRWDPHRSRFRHTQSVLSLIYNRLIQPASVSTGELEADLCALPEQPDELTYVFTLDPSAVFWALEPTNGRSVSADDIVWNITRQQDALDSFGQPDPHFFRRSAYQRTATAEAADAGAVTLTTYEPDAAYLGSVHASPFAWITSPEAAELYGDDWRDDPSDIMRSSGSGPYTPREHNGFEITLARSDNWWRADSAYADGIVFSSGDATNIASVYESAAFDLADAPLSNDAVETLREQYPEHGQFERPLDAAVELITPLASDPLTPLGDPRVIRAVALAVDRPTLLQRLYGEHGRTVGPLPWYLDGWSLDDAQLSSLPGLRGDRDADLAEVSQLIAAAGATASSAPVPLVVADLFEGFFPGAGEALRAMIADATGLQIELEDRAFAEAIDQLREGERFCFLGWGAVAQQADPTDRWRRTLHSTGEDRWSEGASPELDALIDQMGAAFELAERRQLAHQVQELLLSGEAVDWQVKLVNGIQLGIHQPWLNPDPRLFDFAWSTQRLSSSWLSTSLETYPAGRELPPPPEQESAESEDGG